MLDRPGWRGPRHLTGQALARAAASLVSLEKL
jgi:hypothetical protein